MRLNCGEGNGVRLARRTSQSTARIARKDVLMGLPHRIVANLVIPPHIGSALCLPRMELDG
jgi:hypothetical protein